MALQAKLHQKYNTGDSTLTKILIPGGSPAPSKCWGISWNVLKVVDMTRIVA